MEHDDLLEIKLSKSIKNSSNIIHKKIMKVFFLIQEQIGINNTKGSKGCKNYSKKVFELLKLLNDKLSKGSFEEDDIQNLEALLFILTILINNLEIKSIRKLTLRYFGLIEFFFKFGYTNGSFNLKKYLLLILEKCLIAQTESELKDNNNPIVNYTINKVLLIFSEKNEMLQKTLIKVFCKVLRTDGFSANSEFNFIVKLKTFIISKIKGILLGGDKTLTIERIPGVVISPFSTSEAENLLKFLAAVIQFLPFSTINEIIQELFNLLDINNSFILLNSLLCIEISLSCKNFSLEVCEKFIKFLLLNNQNILNFEESDERIIISFIKILSQVMLNLVNNSLDIAIKYLSNVVSLLGELLLSEKESIKNSVTNTFTSIINTVFSEKNIQIINYMISSKDSNNSLSLNDLSLYNQNSDIKKSFEKISILMFDLISDRYSNDLKKSFEILYIYMSRIQKSKELSFINENLIKSISEVSDAYLIKNNNFKNFVAKLFNIVNPRLILNFFPIQCTEYDITSDDYTDESKVWILSYLHKFLKIDLSLKDFFDCFSFLIDEIDKYFIIKSNEGKNIDLDFEIEENDNELHPKIKEIKYKRYVLIYEQVFSLLPYFSLLPPTNSVFYVETFLAKLREVYKNLPEMKIYFYKCLNKILTSAVKLNNVEIINLLKQKCKFYFESCLNSITSLQVKNEEDMKVSFQLITGICKIAPKNVINERICEQVAKFEEKFQSSQLVTKNKNDNNGKDIIIDDQMNTDTKPRNNKMRDKEIQELRIEIVNYLLKQTPLDESLYDLLFSFFNKYYFNDVDYKTRKQLMNLFIILIDNIKIFENLFEVYIKFSQAKGLNLVNSKHKSKLLDFMNKKILVKLNEMENINIDVIENYYFKNIILDIILLTKDSNRKVRNTSYEMIADITDFMTKRGFFEIWLKLNLSILASSESFLKSASIYSISRIFWQNRSSNEFLPFLRNVFEVVILLFKENNKEIIKANFLFLRVLLYIFDNETTISNSKIILNSVFSMKEDLRDEFKVKIRNLVKNLCLKVSFETIKNVFPKEHDNLLNYINKYIVKKINKSISDDKKRQSVSDINMNTSNNIDNSFIDNTDLDFDEEEDFISKEFKKIDKKKREDEKKFYDRIESLQLNDDPEFVKPKAAVQIDKKVEAIDKLLNTDKVIIN